MKTTIRTSKATLTASRAIVSAAAALALIFTAQASAGLMIETYDSGTMTPDVIHGYEMTDFGLRNENCLGCQASSVTLPNELGASVNFLDRDKNVLEMTRSTAANTGWWVNGESADYDIFTTHVNWVELVMPENTRAFSFNVGASFSGWGWMVGYNDGAAKHEMFQSFHVSPKATPGFGVYADNSDGSCGSISSIIIDPQEWGAGNFSINVSECGQDVPEPGVMSLLAIGIIGLGLARRKKDDDA